VVSVEESIVFSTANLAPLFVEKIKEQRHIKCDGWHAQTRLCVNNLPKSFQAFQDLITRWVTPSNFFMFVGAEYRPMSLKTFRYRTDLNIRHPKKSLSMDGNIEQNRI
jgi:hypothetical protein